LPVGCQEDREWIFGNRIGNPVVWWRFFVPQTVIEILDDLVLADVRIAIIFDPNWILPKRPSENS
jgi:hypothetical protein